MSSHCAHRRRSPATTVPHSPLGDCVRMVWRVRHPLALGDPVWGHGGVDDTQSGADRTGLTSQGETTCINISNQNGDAAAGAKKSQGFGCVARRQNLVAKPHVSIFD